MASSTSSSRQSRAKVTDGRAKEAIRQMTPSARGVRFSDRQIPALDGLRGIAVIWVVLFHYLPAAAQGTEPNSPIRLFAHMFMTGWSGVDLFFVLSGFLISGILLDHNTAANYWSVFYAKRTFRILPIYTLLVVGYFVGISFGLPAHFRDSVPWWGYATFTQNIVMAVQDTPSGGVLGVTWSLAVEEQFYLLIPIAVRFLSRQHLMIVTLVCITLVPVLRISPINDSARFLLMPCRADGLLIGILLALIVRDTNLFQSISRYRSTVFGALALTALGMAALLLRADLFSVFTFTVVSAFFGLLVLASLLLSETTILNRALTYAPLRWIGLISYGLYLYHEAVALILHHVLLGKAPNIATAAGFTVMLISLGASVGVAALSFYGFERPILRWAKRYRYSSADEPQGVPQRELVV